MRHRFNLSTFASVFGALLVLLSPFVVAAADDANITGVSFESTTLVTGETTTLTIEFRTPGYTGSALYLAFLGDVNPSQSGFSFKDATLNTNLTSFDAQLSSAAEQNYSIAMLSFSPSALSATGKYAVVIEGVVNGAEGSYDPALSTVEFSDSSNRTTADPVTITDGSAVSDTNPFSAFTMEPADAAAEATTDYTVAFTAGETVLSGSVISLFFNSDSGPAAFDFSGASLGKFSAGTFGSAQQGTVAEITLTADLSAGTYEFGILDVVNIATAGDYRAVITTDVVSPSAAYVESNTVSITAADSGDGVGGGKDGDPGAPAVPTGLKVKKLKQRSATLKWGAVSGATKYKVRLDKKPKTKWKKAKVFKNVKKINKKLKKGRRFLRPNVQYRFRVRSCNAQGCSAFSAAKKFLTKA